MKLRYFNESCAKAMKPVSDLDNCFLQTFMKSHLLPCKPAVLSTYTFCCTTIQMTRCHGHHVHHVLEEGISLS